MSIILKFRDIEEDVDNMVNDMFEKIGNKWKIETGDIAPEQSNQLDNIKEDLTLLMQEFIRQNL